VWPDRSVISPVAIGAVPKPGWEAMAQAKFLVSPNGFGVGPRIVARTRDTGRCTSVPTGMQAHASPPRQPPSCITRLLLPATRSPAGGSHDCACRFSYLCTFEELGARPCAACNRPTGRARYAGPARSPRAPPGGGPAPRGALSPTTIRVW